MSGLPSDTREYEVRPETSKGARDVARRIGDVWQRLGTSGAASGTNGGMAFLSSTPPLTPAVVGVVNILDVITMRHEEPQYGLAGPIVWEGTSWVALMAFALDPVDRVPAGAAARRGRAGGCWRFTRSGAVLFAVAHVGGFVLLRKLIYWLAGASYDFGALGPSFLYEFSKDAFGYVHDRRRVSRSTHWCCNADRAAPAGRGDVRDPRRGADHPRAGARHPGGELGGKLCRVLPARRAQAADALAAGRRSRSSWRGTASCACTGRWLVNAMQMTGLKPQGSGDYTVELGALTVPLSRRFPEALAKLRAG